MNCEGRRLLVSSAGLVDLECEMAEPDPAMSLAGQAASLAEIADGWYVSRRLRARHGVLTHRKVFDLSRSESVLVESEPGEGKTSLLAVFAQLELESCSGRVPVAPRTLLPPLQELQSLARAGIAWYLLLDLDDANLINQTIPFAELDQLRREGHPTVFVTANASGYGHGRFLSCRFEPPNVDEVKELAALAKRALNSHGFDSSRTPNLRCFVQHPLRYFKKNDGFGELMLKATLGLEFRRLLIAQAEQVPPDCKDLFQYALLFSAVGMEAPFDLIARAATFTDVAPNGTPSALWQRRTTRDGTFSFRTRSPIAARCLLVDGRHLQWSELEGRLRRLLCAAQTSETSAGLARNLLQRYAHPGWGESLVPSGVVGGIRTAARDALLSEDGRKLQFKLTKRLSDAGAGGECALWARLCHALLPKPRKTRSRKAVDLVDMMEEWLQVARRSSAYPNPHIYYFQTKVPLIRAQYDQGQPTDSDVQEALSAWGELFDQGHNAPDFLVDYGTLLLKTVSATKPLSVDSWVRCSRVLHCAVVVGDKRARRLARKFMHQVYGVFEADEALRVFRAAWQETVKFGAPDPESAWWIGRTEVRRSGSLSAATEEYLIQSLSWCPYGDAFLMLARNGSDRGQKVVRDAVHRLMEDDSYVSSPLNAALVATAGAEISAGQPQEVRMLELAHGKFCEAAGENLQSMWERYGSDYWRKVVEKLANHEIKEPAGVWAARQEEVRQQRQRNRNWSYPG